MTSDFGNVAAELDAALKLRAAQFFVTQRPWLDLYGVNVRPVAPFGSASSKTVVDLALIHRVLPDELIFEIWVECKFTESKREQETSDRLHLIDEETD